MNKIRFYAALIFVVTASTSCARAEDAVSLSLSVKDHVFSSTEVKL